MALFPSLLKSYLLQNWGELVICVKDEVKQALVAEGHQLEIGAQRAPRFLVAHNTHYIKKELLLELTIQFEIF